MVRSNRLISSREETLTTGAYDRGMHRTIASLLLACVATAVAKLPALADEVVLHGRSVDVHRTHPLSPGREYGPNSADPCRQLAAALWGPDYVAGVDTRGHGVAPADLDRGRYGGGPVVSFDIPVPRPPGAVRPDDLIAGTITVDTATGHVDLDCRPLTPSDLAYLREACADH
jgi:hypothetical protein